VQAVILAGGKGTRIHALHPDRPKALIPIAGKPFLQWQLEWLARGGVRDVHIAAGYKAEALKKWLIVSSISQIPSSQFPVSCVQFPVSGFSLSLSLSAEPHPLGTGGGLKFVEPFLLGDPFLVLNGDSLMPNLNFNGLKRAHGIFSNVWTTMAITQIQNAGRYGAVEFGEDGTITAFREKASRDAGWINGGVYLMNRQMLEAIEAGTNTSIETEVFPALAQRGLLRIFRTAPPLLDMGTPEGIRAMERFLAASPT
jgi:NDP-sugar pyrophosphorylase family protein